MPGRKFTAGNTYRYGFNGKENDKDIGNDDYDFEARIYDARLGRFFSVDPHTRDYADLSPYSFGDNNPIYNIDPSGMDGVGWWQRALSITLDFVPGLGTLKGVAEAVIGYDLITGEELDPLDRTIGALGGVGELIGVGRRLLKVADKLEETVNIGRKVDKGIEVADEIKKSAKVELEALPTPPKQAPPVLPVETPKAKLKNEKAPDVMPAVCFVSGTLIFTNTGTIKIEEIVSKDSVWSFDEVSKKSNKRVVLQTFVRRTDKLVRIKISNETIWSSTEHPFYVNGKWIPAKNLQKGFYVVSFNRTNELVEDVVIKDTIATVYNFSVDIDHNYYISSSKILVHNPGPGNNPCAQQTALPKGGTYTLTDPLKNEVKRTGKTNNLERRAKEHARAKETKDLKFDIDKRSDDPLARTGREQIIYDQNKKTADLNKRRPISPSNPKKDQMMQKGRKL